MRGSRFPFRRVVHVRRRPDLEYLPQVMGARSSGAMVPTNSSYLTPNTSLHLSVPDNHLPAQEYQDPRSSCPFPPKQKRLVLGRSKENEYRYLFPGDAFPGCHCRELHRHGGDSSSGNRRSGSGRRINVSESSHRLISLGNIVMH